MPFHFEQDNNQQSITFSLHESFNLENDMYKIHRTASQAVSTMQVPVYRILDLTATNLDFGSVTQFLQSDTGNEAGTATDKRFIPIFIGNDKMTKLIAESLGQVQYGGIEAYNFPTIYVAQNFIGQRDQMIG